MTTLFTLFNAAIFYLSVVFACKVALVRTNQDNSEAYFLTERDDFGAYELFSPSRCALDHISREMDHLIEGEWISFKLPLESDLNVLLIVDSAFYTGEAEAPLSWIPVNIQSSEKNLEEGAMATLMALIDQKPKNKLAMGQFMRLTKVPPVKLVPLPLSQHRGGIRNLGNTCYMNAALQALWNSSLFRDMFERNFANHSTNPLVSSLGAIFQSMDSGELANVAILKTFIENVKDFTIIQDMNAQNDPQEFIDGLLEGLAQTFRAYPLLPNSEVDKLFIMEQEDVTRCACGYSKRGRNPTPFIKTALQDNDRMNIKLTDLLDRFKAVNEIVGFLDHSEPDHKMISQVLVHNISPILIVQINRRGPYDEHRGYFRKNEQKVDFPIDGLDMTKYIRYAAGDPVFYDLVSIISHSGHVGAGHYTAYLRRGDHFVFANDSQRFVEYKGKEELNFMMEDAKQGAVELVYQRRGTIANYKPMNNTL